jgi:hypothetical protein
MHEGHYKNKLKRTRKEIMNEAASERFPALQKMLGNLPPTPSEIALIKAKGPWPGFGYPEKNKSKRYNQTVAKRSNRQASPKWT